MQPSLLTNFPTFTSPPTKISMSRKTDHAQTLEIQARFSFVKMPPFILSMMRESSEITVRPVSRPFPNPKLRMSKIGNVDAVRRHRAIGGPDSARRSIFLSSTPGTPTSRGRVSEIAHVEDPA